MGNAEVKHVRSNGAVPDAETQARLHARVGSAMNGSDILGGLTALLSDLPELLGPGIYGFAWGHGGLAYGIQTRWFAEFESPKGVLVMWRT